MTSVVTLAMESVRTTCVVKNADKLLVGGAAAIRAREYVQEAATSSRK